MQNEKIIHLNIDGEGISVREGTTILQAAKEIGVEIPRFCYHERLSIAGNCRMCLVEVEKSAKPIASCAMPVMEGMKVHTNTDMVKKAREGVMEFLLVNHPLDCPICDQGGECDLQDQAMVFGSDRGRYYEYKRAVEDKNCGPLIKTVMTRCIQCTRCVRYATEIAGVPDLGTTGRGSNMEIGTYVEKVFDSEISGNIIDLCPVGALTSKPYAFTARSWELQNTESVDVSDAVGSNITIGSRGSEIMRILPRINEHVNEEWISDKTRFQYDGIKRQRLNVPMVKKNGSLTPTTWKEALQTVAHKLLETDPSKIGAIAGQMSDCESMLALKDLMTKVGSPNSTSSEGFYHIDPDLRPNYIFNTSIEGLESADLCLLIGSNPRYEAPMVNTRLRKGYLRGDLTVASIGFPVDLTFPVEQLGNNPKILAELLDGTHPFSQILEKAENPVIIVGMSVLNRSDGESLLKTIQKIATNHGVIKPHWNGLNLLHVAANQVGALDIGFVPGPSSPFHKINLRNKSNVLPFDLIYVLNADDYDYSQISDKTFVIYQGHHGDRTAHLADIILPGSSFVEKNSTFTNTEGRPQETNLVFVPPGEGREDWKILRALSEVMGMTLPYNQLKEVRARLVSLSPSFSEIGKLSGSEYSRSLFESTEFELSSFFETPIHPLVTKSSFYMTNSISRSSQNMAKCVSEFKERKYNRIVKTA